MAALRLLLMSMVAVITIGQIMMQTEAFFLNLQHVEQPVETTDFEDIKASRMAMEDLETSDHTKATDIEITDFNISNTEEPENVTPVMVMANLETSDHTKVPKKEIADFNASGIENPETIENVSQLADIEDAKTIENVLQMADNENAENIGNVPPLVDNEDAKTIENVPPLPDNEDAEAIRKVTLLADNEDSEIIENVPQMADNEDAKTIENIPPLAGNEDAEAIEKVTPLADNEDAEIIKSVPTLADRLSLVDRSIMDLKEGDNGILVDNEVPSNRTKRNALECGLSPEGVTKPCLVCDGSRYVFFTDINGHTCKCEVCRVPKYMEVPCLCTPNGEVESGPQCSFPTIGVEYMNVSNFCDRPKKCSQCEGNLEVKLSCTLTTDTVCGCPKDTYQTGHNKCDPIPPCRKNFEIHEIGRADSIYRMYECRPCKDGFTQPNDNSLDRCRPIEETPEVPSDDDTAEEHPLSTPKNDEPWNKEMDEPKEASSTMSETTQEFNCPPDYCPPGCCASEPQYILKTEADAVESAPKGCNVTTDYDYTDEEHGDNFTLLSSFIEHPIIWLGLAAVVITFILLLSVMIALVYGSKNAEKVRKLVEGLGMDKCFYPEPDPEFYRSEGLPLYMNPQDTHNSQPQPYNCPNTNANETQPLTSRTAVINEHDDTGEQRRKSNRVLLRERSRTDSTNIE